MIRIIRGQVVDTTPPYITLMTDGGVGYGIAVPATVNALPGDILTLYTYLAVRETAHDLYGFLSTTDRAVFELLLTLSGIGPKSALQILNQSDVALLLDTIGSNDAERLSKQSGLSKKTAEKIVLGLKDSSVLLTLGHTHEVATETSDYQDAFETLTTLGYAPHRVRDVLSRLPSNETTSVLVKEALRLLQ